MFLSKMRLISGSWQAFERSISRLLLCEGFLNVRVVGMSGDHGADVVASRYGKRWIFQAKHWNKSVGISIVEETLKAMRDYEAQVPVIVSAHGFDQAVYDYQKSLLMRGIGLQLWTVDELVDRANKLSSNEVPNKKRPREYQESAIQRIVEAYINKYDHRALIVLATGLGKTFVAAEAMRRIHLIDHPRVLVLAHTNPLVEQLERAFWPFLYPSQTTLVWNGYERPSQEMLESSNMIFACVDSVAEYLSLYRELPSFDVVIVDECHHAGSSTYRAVLNYYNIGSRGSFALGLTATPWRPDEVDIRSIFGDPRIQVDMIKGMQKGFLTNIDYRMHTDNIDWDSLKNINGQTFSPRQINRTLFINQWDDAVVVELQKVWKEQAKPRAIVFCGTIEHAIIMRDKINALGFCNAAAIYSQGPASVPPLSPFERNKLLSDFADGIVNVVCTVDIFNEGIDVPDVNIIVFQRVTHSRRIYIQQLGRGLRISKDKDKLIVLDFVSDIRRFAAGLDLKDKLTQGVRINLPNKVIFTRVDGEDPHAEEYLRKWLEDVGKIEMADEDISILKMPPKL